MRSAPVVAASLLLVDSGLAFAPPRNQQQSCSSSTKRTRVGMMGGDVHSLQDISTTLLEHHDVLGHHASTWIADAAVASDAATEDIGLWEKYIQIYKNGLALVHDTIDGPLRDAGFTQTWGISIALFTAGVRALLIPFSISQNKSTEYSKALKPYQKKIKEKYSDKNMQNRAISKLYEDAEQNPLAGCITSFAQIPIFLGLYRSVTRLAAESRLDEPFLWIPSLEGPVSAENNYRGMQWLTEGWSNGAPSMGWEGTLPFLIMPVVLVIMQSITMQLLQQPDDESASEEEKEQLERTKSILKFLPLMIGFFSLQVPAGLTIYWFTSNLFTVSQSLAIRAYYAANPPKIELPDYWEALDDKKELTADERREAAMAGLSTGPTFDELMDEAKFHYVVQRGPLRAESEAWSRVEGSDNVNIPAGMKSWVGDGAIAELTEAEVSTQQPEVAPVS
mmetsp:Transcript_11015/g.25627  ORF Transcript_11015/g.25627 Transcript_11015/m.25627 type:complete len:449 (+) Transcript_11015:45-1391(+)